MSKEIAMNLCVEVHRLVAKLPPEEIYVLAEMLRRSAVDIALNVEELDFAKVRGKIAALETLLLICVRLNYFKDSDMQAALNLCAKLERMLNAQ